MKVSKTQVKENREKLLKRRLNSFVTKAMTELALPS